MTVHGEQYLGSKAANPLSYTLRNGQVLGEAKQTLESRSAQQKITLMELYAKIEADANQLGINEAQQAIQRAQFLSSGTEPTPFDKIIQAFLREDVAALLETHPGLTQSQLLQIFTDVKHYLHVSTQQNKIIFLLKMMGEIEQSTAGEVQEKHDQLAAEISRERAYDPDAHPEYLVFEHYMGFQLKEDQIQAIDDLKIVRGKISNPKAVGKLIELIMGAGKTSVIIPLLGMINADGENLPIVVFPKASLHSMSLELRHTVGTAFDLMVEQMEFSRHSHFDTEDLTRILDRFKDIRENRKILLIPSDSIQALFLKMAETMIKYTEVLGIDPVELAQYPDAESFLWAVGGKIIQRQKLGDDAAVVPGEEHVVNLFLKVIKELKQSGVALVDEIDTIFDVLKSFQYTIGAPAELSPLPTETSSDLFRYILKNPQLHEILPFLKSAGSQHPNQLPTDHYREVLRGKLVEAVISGDMKTGGTEWKEFIDRLWEYKGLWRTNEREYLRQYLQGDLSEDVLSFTDNIASSKVQDILALLKEQFNTLLPLAMTKQLGGIRGYGPSPDIENGGRNLAAIPYDEYGRPTAPGTQHGSELATIDFTILQYLQNKITPALTKKLIEHLVERIEMQKGKSRSAGLRPTEEYLMFQKLTNKDTSFNINSLSSEQIEAITRLINESPLKILEVVKLVVLPEILVYPRKLETNAQLFGVVLSQIQGMSGTIWNRQTYPSAVEDADRGRLLPVESEFPYSWHVDTTARTLSFVWSKAQTTILQPGSVQDQAWMNGAIEKIVSTKDNRPCSIIDSGNIFGGIPNEVLARHLLTLSQARSWNTEGIAYYDKTNHLMVLTRSNKQWNSQPFEAVNIPKDKLLAVWDLAHTTGSNIILSPTMEAGVTIGKDALLRDIMQAVWRLRGLEKEQAVHFIISSEDQSVMKNTIANVTGRKIQGNLTFKDIVLYLLVKQTERQGQDNYIAFKQKINAIVLDKIVTAMLKAESPAKAAEIYMVGHTLFETTLDQRPYQLYTTPSKDVPTQEAVRMEIRRFKKSPLMNRLQAHPTLKHYYPEIVQELRSLKETVVGSLPDMVPQQQTHAATVVVETTATVEKSTQQQTQIAIEIATDIEVEHETATDNGEQDAAEVSDFRPSAPVIWDATEIPVTPAYLDAQSDLFHATGAILQRDFPDISALYDPNLLCSENLCPLRLSPGIAKYFSGEPTYHPFDTNQKQMSQLLVIKNRGNLQIMMMDLNDVQQWKTILRNRSELATDHAFQIALYDIHTGLYMDGSQAPIDSVSLEKDPRFLKLKTQAKFFNGEISYTDDELTILRDWFSKHDVRKIEIFFDKTVRPWLAVNKEVFNRSSLKKLFLELSSIAEKSTIRRVFDAWFK